MALPNSPRAVVTGAGSGLGRALCLQLAKRRGRVLVTDIDAEGAEATARLVREAGGEAHAFRCDVTDPQHVQAMAAEADARLGGVDLLANNAGVAVAGRIGDIPLADWRWQMDVNLWGPVHCCHEFVPRLRRQGRGHVLNVASAAGIVGASFMAPYSMSKFALVGLSEALAGDLAPHGVGVTVLCPTFFRTEIARNARGPDERVRAAVQRFLDAAKITADDVARMALEGCDRGRLYVYPQSDARMLSRLKRLMPQRMVALAPKMLAAEARKLGVDLNPGDRR